MAAILIVCALLQSATPDEWFNQQRVVAEKALQSGEPDKVKQAKESFTAMRARARDDQTTDWIIYAEWKIARCDFRLGHYAEAEEALEQLIRAYPAEQNGLLLLIHQDLAKLYGHDSKIKQAVVHIQAALDLPHSYSFRGTSHTFSRFDEMCLLLVKADYLVATVDGKDAAKELLTTLRSEVWDSILALGKNLKATQPRADQYKRVLEDIHAREYLLAGVDMDWAEVDRRDGRTLEAVTRQKACLERLRRIVSDRSVELQVRGQIALACNYWKLTRFTDADAALQELAGLVADKKSDQRYEELESTRAQLHLEWAFSEFDRNPHDPAILTHLESVDRSTKAALAYHAKTTDEHTISSATGLNSRALAEELRGRICDAARKPDEAQQAYNSAKNLADDSVKLFEAILPADHDILLDLRRNRAWLRYKVGDVDEARREASVILAMYAERYGPRSNECAPCHLLLIDIETQAGNIAEAALHAEAHRRLTSEHLVSYVAGLTPAEQQSFSRRWDDPGLHASLRLGVRDAALAAASAAWLINGKAKTSEVLASTNRQARGSPHLPAFRDAVERQAYLLYGPVVKDRDSQLLVAEKKKRELAERRATATAAPWFELEKLAAELQPDEVFVDIFGLSDETNSARTYYAWIVTADDPVRVVALGDAAIIDSVVATLLKRLAAFGARRSSERPDGDAEDEEQLRQECLVPLSQMILAPVRQAAAGKTRWIVSPDGALWDVPWATLILDETREYAVKSLTFRYVISGRDVFARSPPSTKLGQSVVVADPSYDVTPSAQNAKGTDALRGLRRVGQLPASAQEGKEVAECLAAKNLAAILRTGKQATKQVVLDLDPPPRMLYLSTHGFFDASLPVSDPFLCCGVLFAGFNAAHKPGEAARLPGLLSGAEVLLANLRGTELVVLSACQTGTGVTAYGHSAASLRHAFHLAGARAVVSSLWAVSDATTKDLLVSFMNDVAGGLDKADALRLAQLKRIDQFSRGEYPHTHPFLWGAFTLSGF